MTEEQAELAAIHANERARGRVGIMFDTDTNGDNGAKEALWRLQQLGIDAQLVWSRKTHSGRFTDRQPESLTSEEWKDIAGTIRR